METHKEPELNWRVNQFHKRGWLSACEACATNDHLFAEFRRNSQIIPIVASEQHDPVLDHRRAHAYYQLVMEAASNMPKWGAIHTMDRIGGPLWWKFDDHLISREMLRYLHTYQDIAKRLTITPQPRIIELGGGFGGQAAIFNWAATNLNTLVDYTIVDYHEVGLLQKRYCKECLFSPTLLTTENFDCKMLPEYDLFISNYALDELPEWQQRHYLQIAERCRQGYITANCEPERLFGLFPVREQTQEHPSIGSATVMWW